MSERARALVSTIVVSTIVAATVVGAGPAAAAPLRALPETIRVNVSGLGTPSATIGSTGSSLTVTAADGRTLYRGAARTVARTNVYRLADDGVAIPDRRTAPNDPEERAIRRERLREARRAERELGPRAIIVVPFELAALRSPDEPIGDPILRADRVTSVRYQADDGLLSFNGRVFRGTLEIAVDDEGDMIVVNTVRTADYLASVVGAEIPATWMPEALAAQAIAARTYLLTHLRRHRAYDLEGDVRDQAYGGLGTESDSTVRAVERTAGVVATYRGAAIEALYSANAGGITEDSENVYANALPYLRSVPSPWDKLAETSSWGRTSWEWTREITAPQLRDHLLVRGIDVGEPQRIELLDLAPTGRVMRARVIGSRGSRDIGKDASRYYFGLRSSLFTVEVRPGGEPETVDYKDADRIRTLEGLGARRVGTSYRVVRDDDRKIVAFFVTSFTFELPARFEFKGKGFGHGVGMSQWGMQGMALEGASAERILAYYYRGIALAQVGGP
ncbi:MAG: SpoIID/LytB domain-containing protein [Chloroflexota bacterium]